MPTTIIDIPIPNYALTALHALEDAGHEAWLVGGCVRDAILGRPVHDYDIATGALWEETERALANRGITVHRTGTKHGTVTASIEGHPIEITTYRTDGAYSDGRHPDNVEFVRNIEDDLARRDFTMNALAYHPERGVLDCWDGLADLEQGVIRTVGDPFKRFREDALRVLRGCRFASQLGFSIEPATLQAMTACKMGLQRVAAERVTHELDELLLGEHVHDALMETIDVLVAVLPEIAACKNFDQQTPYHIYDVWEHTAWVVQHSPVNRLSRWAALFHDIGKPAACFLDGDRAHFFGHPKLSALLASDIMRRLLFAPAFCERVLTLVRMHDVQIAATPKSVKKTLAKLDGDVDLFQSLIYLKRADALAQSDLNKPRLQLSYDLQETLDQILTSNSAFSLKQLHINGRDVLDLGVAEGPEIGQVLQECLEAVIDERVENEREALMAFAQALVRQC